MDWHKLAKHLRPYEGKEAILRERPLTARVRLRRIVADQWGVTIRVRALPTRGLWTPPTSHWTLSAAWCVLNVGSRSWSAAYAEWALYVDPEAVRAVVSAAEQFTSDVNDLLEWADGAWARNEVLMRRYAALVPILRLYQ